MFKSSLIIISAVLLTGCTPEINKPTELLSIEPTTDKYYLVKTKEGSFYVEKKDIKNYQVGEFYIVKLEKAQ